MSVQNVIMAIKGKLPEIKQGVSLLKPLFNKEGENINTAEETQESYNSKIGETTEQESPLKKYGMYIAIGVVLYMLMKKKK